MYVPTLCLVPFSFSVWVFFPYVILLICGAISQLSPRKKKDVWTFCRSKILGQIFCRGMYVHMSQVHEHRMINSSVER